MKLIADSGSTKTTWVLIDDNQSRKQFSSEGYNPFFIKTPAIIESLKKNLLSDLNASSVSEIHFYGSGVSNDENVKIINDAFDVCFPDAKFFIEHDLLASCRALLGKEKGFAAILGTGTNTALYDGKQVELNIDSLGYGLGDEGSGSYIGRLLLRNYLRDFMPEELKKSFQNHFKTDKLEILKGIYERPLPNRFLASYASFSSQHISHPFIQNLVHEAFHDFFENIVAHYPNYTSYQFNCVGSIGFYLKDILEKTSNDFGMKTGKIIQSPIEGLVKFHLEN